MTKHILIALAVMAGGQAAFAGSPFLTGDEAATEAMQRNAPEEFDGVPKFLLFGKTGKFYVGIGGKVMVTLGEDFGHPVDNPDMLVTADIPMGATDGNGARFHVSAGQTSLYINAVALPGTKNAVGAFINVNLTGGNYAPVVEYAYLRWRGLQAGIDYTLFSDPSSNPPGLDYEGPNSIAAVPSTGIRYTLPFGPGHHWRFQAGAELPMANFTQALLHGIPRAVYVNQRVPDIPLALRYEWGGASHVRLAAIVRNLYSRRLPQARNIDHVGWGLHLSYTGEVLPGLTAFASGIYGEGISSYIQDLNGYDHSHGMDLFPDASGTVLTPVKLWGAYGALNYDFNEHLSLCGKYSQVRAYADAYPGGETAWGDQYKYARYASATLFWNVNSYLQAGLEYIWGSRTDFSGATAHVNRLQLGLAFNY